MATPKKDQDKADEQTPTGAQTTIPADPTFKPAKLASRIKGAYFLGGAWYAADGSTLTAPETQQAHRAMDAAAAEARRKALLGGGE